MDSGWCLIVSFESFEPSSPRHNGGSNVAAIRSRHGVERSHARSTT